MAIRKRGSNYQVYWRNPLTGAQEVQACATLKEARKLDSLVKHRKEHERESFTQDTPPARADGMTVEDVVYAHLKSKQITPLNLAHTISHARPCLSEIGQVQVSDLTKHHMRELVKAMRATGVTQLTLNRRISIIKAALTWAAEDEELIETNPVAQFKCPRGEEKKTVPPSPAEARRILAVAPPHVYRAVLLSFYLGVRVGPSELFKLTWEYVDMERGVVNVPAAKKNKTVSWREVGISADLAPLLMSWGEADGWQGPLVHYDGHAITHMKRAWASTLKAAGIERSLTPYSLRHAFATYALSNGADIGALAKIMGHSSTAMIHRHYQHVLDSQRRQVTDSLPKIVDIQERHTATPADALDSSPFCMSTDADIELKQ